jgi:hypothetical protein
MAESGSHAKMLKNVGSFELSGWLRRGHCDAGEDVGETRSNWCPVAGGTIDCYACGSWENGSRTSRSSSNHPDAFTDGDVIAALK